MPETSFPLLTDIGLCLIFAVLASHVIRLIRQPLILGYILGGILLGSQIGFGLVANEQSIELISEIGLIFLLFIIGLEINLRELVSIGKRMLTIGLVQFLTCAGAGVGFFYLLGIGFDSGPFDPLYVGVALALSSTLIVVKLLNDKFEVNTTAGRLTVGVLVLQDLCAIVFMAIQPNITSPHLGTIFRSLVLGAILILVAFAASRYLLARIFKVSGKSPELVLLTSIAWCFILCGLAEKVGLSKEMGALIAGLSIAAFPYGTDVIAKLTGIRDFFVTLFFVSLGLKIPMPTLQIASLSMVAVAFVMATRLFSIVPVVYLFRQGLRNGLVTALNLSQVSEFSLVIVALGVSYGHVSSTLSYFILTTMIFASVFSTYLIQWNDPLARLLMRFLSLIGIREENKQSEGAEAGHVHQKDIVLLGCFREGFALLDQIEQNAPHLKERTLVFDFNPSVGERIKKRGFHWVYGDLAHYETLKQIKIDQASMIICSVSDTFLKGTTNLRILKTLKQLAPQARIVMTADDPEGAARLRSEGAAEVLIPSDLSGAHLFRVISEAAG